MAPQYSVRRERDIHRDNDTDHHTRSGVGRDNHFLISNSTTTTSALYLFINVLRGRATRYQARHRVVLWITEFYIQNTTRKCSDIILKYTTCSTFSNLKKLFVNCKLKHFILIDRYLQNNRTEGKISEKFKTQVQEIINHLRIKTPNLEMI